MTGSAQKGYWRFCSVPIWLIIVFFHKNITIWLFGDKEIETKELSDQVKSPLPALCIYPPTENTLQLTCPLGVTFLLWLKGKDKVAMKIQASFSSHKTECLCAFASVELEWQTETCKPHFPRVDMISRQHFPKSSRIWFVLTCFSCCHTRHQLLLLGEISPGILHEKTLQEQIEAYWN